MGYPHSAGRRVGAAAWVVQWMVRSVTRVSPPNPMTSVGKSQDGAFLSGMEWHTCLTSEVHFGNTEMHTPLILALGSQKERLLQSENTYSALELLELGKMFKQAIKEPLTTCLMRLWDMGTERISLRAAKAEKLSNITTHPLETECTT